MWWILLNTIIKIHRLRNTNCLLHLCYLWKAYNDDDDDDDDNDDDDDDDDDEQYTEK